MRATQPGGDDADPAQPRPHANKWGCSSAAASRRQPRENRRGCPGEQPLLLAWAPTKQSRSATQARWLSASPSGGAGIGQPDKVPRGPLHAGLKEALPPQAQLAAAASRGTAALPAAGRRGVPPLQGPASLGSRARTCTAARAASAAADLLWSVKPRPRRRLRWGGAEGCLPLLRPWMLHQQRTSLGRSAPGEIVRVWFPVKALASV
jgi:hypothetical protein